MKSTGIYQRLFIVLALSAMIVIVYRPVGRHGYIEFDDPVYVTENRMVRSGITWEGARWSLTAAHAANWHPLTWMSHMLDVELFGMDPGKHHQMNVGFHVLNTLLLFVVLGAMTGALWRSALAAALFAVHPLHVESVAWVAERKDVLSTCFLLLTMAAYRWYAKRPGTGRYLLVVTAFVFGLMAKPMLVTLPFVLLLLDFWPLGRLGRGGPSSFPLDGKSAPIAWWHLVLEKMPLLALSVLSSVITFRVQQDVGAVAPTELFPLPARAANALVSYVGYIGKMFWPLDLAAFYPYTPGGPSLAAAVAAALFLLAASALALLQVRRRPYLATGWFWYLGTLLPVIGVVQVGIQAMADRYTYVPLTGLCIALIWGFGDLSARWRHGRLVIAASSAVLFSVLMFTARIQAGYWQSSLSLFEHALEVTADNEVARNNIGIVLARQGRYRQAREHLARALLINPGYFTTYYNLGKVSYQQGMIDDAVRYYQQALKIDPGHGLTHYNLGNMYMRQGEAGIAVGHYEEALRTGERSARALNNLGVALWRLGRMEEAMEKYREALRIDPNRASTYNNMGNIYRQQGRAEEAVASYLKALSIDPGYAQARSNLEKVRREGKR